MFLEDLEETVPANFDTGVAELPFENSIELPATQPWLKASLTAYQGDDEILVNRLNLPRPLVLVEILSSHAHAGAQTGQSHPFGSFELLSRATYPVAPCFFLNAAGSTPVCSQRISKND